LRTHKQKYDIEYSFFRAKQFDRRAECRRRRNIWSATAQIGGAAENATAALT